MHASKKSLFPILALSVGLAGVILLIALSAASPGMSSGLAQISATPPVTPTNTPTPAAILYMPWMSVFKTPEVELLNAWTSQTLDGKLQAFLQGVPMYYQTSGVNHLAGPVQIGLGWQQSGPCSAGQVFSITVSIPSGSWSHYVQGSSPSCTGVFTATASMSYTATNASLAPRFVVNEPGTVKVNVQQGFDKCSHPELDDMQVWWDKSPYVVFNLYLGGVSYACKNNELDAVYVRQLAEQGWWFIPTWVGPQAPCSRYTHKMSDDRDEAYGQGKVEADAAFNRAEELGLFGQKIIYYDLEAYTGDTSCRNTVKAFMRGWTERLHERGSKAGGYGASCRSYIEDWATNSPPPDDIWIAHWIADGYDPSATVWDAVCLDPTTGPPEYWLNHQRLRQYAGGHPETYGGVPLTIDSNVLDGEVIDLAVAGGSQQAAPNSVTLETSGLELRNIGLVDAERGWLLRGADGLLWTQDRGDSWRRVTPEVLSGGRIMAVSFRDAAEGWVVGLSSGGELWAARTLDGGGSWQANRLPLSRAEVQELAGASLAVLPGDHQEGGQVYAALELQSGSSFSLGRLFRTVDGGLSWEERSMPLGEEVVFLDSQRGWTAGGAAGDQIYRTIDGGLTWQAQKLDYPDGASIEVGLPRFEGVLEGWLPVQVVGGGDALTLVYTTQDGGESWKKDSVSAHSHEIDKGIALGLKPGAGIRDSGALPDGTVVAAGIPQGMVWALAQNGQCVGDKHAAGDDPVICAQSWNLLRSKDGGGSWELITPPL